MAVRVSVRAKFTVPRLNSWVVRRQRLRDRLFELREGYQVVWVVGSAGAGKTTAVVDLVSDDEASTWLTLDDSDTAPGRLLTHLEAALLVTFPDLGHPASDGLRAGMPHVEAAAFLADALSGKFGTIVLDELEHLDISADAAVTLSSFVRGLPPLMRVLLVSRRSVTLRLGSSLSVGGVGRLEEQELALDVGEAGRLFEMVDRVDIDPGEAVRATGGWITGVLFEAWRSPDHTHGNGGEADPLSGYLAAEIMSDLTIDQQWFLTATSVLEDVTANAAVALGLPEAPHTLATFRGRFLPLWTSDDGSELRCHPRFRQYLRRRLDQSGSGAQDVHRRHAVLLLAAGRAADAVQAALAAHDAALMGDAVERGVPEALARGDVGQVSRWLACLRRDHIEASQTLTHAELIVAVDGEAWARGAELSDHLLSLLETTPHDPSLAGTMAACYSHVGRQGDALRVLASARPGAVTDAWLSGIGLDVTDATDHYRDRPPDCGQVVDGMLHRFDLMHGRLGRLVDSRPAPWNASRSSRVAALRAVGRLHDAEELLADWTNPDRSPALNRIRVELLLDLGRSEEATALLDSAAEQARNSSAYCEHLHLLLDASVALRFRRDIGSARRSLALLERDPTARHHRRVVEQLPLWRGLADLLGRRFDDAKIHLQAALDVMLQWDRQLHVPFAAVYLAETAWHTGDSDLVRVAGEAALHAAHVQGSDHLLLQALREFPKVVSRALNASDDSSDAWRRLGRQLNRKSRSVEPGTGGHNPTSPSLRSCDLGPSALVVDGSRIIPRLSRCLDLVAYLALPQHAGRARRSAVLVDLFDGRTDDGAAAYLRRTIAVLRTITGPDCIDLSDGWVRWAYADLRSDWVDASRAAREALVQRGPRRLPAIERVLPELEGDYLPKCRAEWAADVRREADDLREVLLLDAADAAYDAGQLLAASAYVDQVLELSPYRETAWRLAMRVAGDLGDDDRVLALYRDCQLRLAEVPVLPSVSTVRLVEDLRR